VFNRLVDYRFNYAASVGGVSRTSLNTKKQVRFQRSRQKLWEVKDVLLQQPRYAQFDMTDWIHLALDRDQWWAPVNTVMNLQILHCCKF